MSHLYDRFVAFFNGMVAGITMVIQDGRKFLLCSPSKSSKSDYKPNLNRHPSTVVLWIASPKSSKTKGLLLYSRVQSL